MARSNRNKLDGSTDSDKNKLGFLKARFKDDRSLGRGLRDLNHSQEMSPGQARAALKPRSNLGVFKAR